MSGNIDNDRSLTTGKMFPIDLAPQKITIVKSVSNNEVKMAHLLSGQHKASGSSQIITHASAGASLMRPGIAQIISPSVASQPQMIVSGSPILQGAQIVSQGSQLIGPSTQIISQPQLLTPSGQILSPGTQIISQGTQLSAHVSSSNNTGNIQANVVSSGTGTQVMNVGQLVGGTGNLVVNSSVRTLPSTVRVLPPLPHHNTRPVLSNVNVSNSGVLVSKAVTSHVPRGLAAGASLAVRPVAPTSSTHQVGTQASGPGWASVRGGPTSGPRGPNIGPSHAPIVSLPTTSVLSSASVISGTLRGAPSTTPRPLPLLQRNYHPAKVVGVSGVGVRGVGNSAPPQLYYAPPAHAAPRPNYPHAATHNTHATHLTNHHLPSTQVNVVNSIPVCPAPAAVNQVQPRPSILRKREIEGSRPGACGGWEDVPAGAPGSGGSTTISASSSPAPDDPEPAAQEQDFSPRKKPRKQILTNEVRQCEFPPEEPPRPPSPVAFNPPPKRPQLVSMYVCGWRSTALHFVRPADVRRREPRAKDILAIASQRHVLTSADGWKVHHLTAQMDDLVSLESDVGEQLTTVLKALENASGRALTAIQPHTHTLLELLKGNIQRSKIVCEGIQEAREDILRVFTHRNFVSDILTRQADKRCFRKHRSQS